MAIDGITSNYSVPYLYPSQSVVGVEDDFAVDSSALRSEEVAPVEVIGQIEPVTLDPADAERFARDFPDILMAQAMAPQPLREDDIPAIEEGGSSAAGLLWQGDSLRGEDFVAYETVEEGDDASGVGNGEEAEGTEASGTAEAGETDASGQDLSEDEQRQVKELKATDQEVRTHEQAHMAVGGRYSGGVSYEYQQGPDGGRYAVAGEVSIDTSAENDPEATIAKMQQVRAAALAPANPSGQDRSVAAAASNAEMEARSELAAEKTEGAQGSDSEEGEGSGEGESVSAAEDASASSGIDSGSGSASGGVASLKSNNPYVNAYAASSARGDASSMMLQMGGYRPIDIVA